MYVFCLIEKLFRRHFFPTWATKKKQEAAILSASRAQMMKTMERCKRKEEKKMKKTGLRRSGA
jgi:hypothetical protein